MEKTNTTSVHKSFPMAEIQKEVNIYFLFQSNFDYAQRTFLPKVIL